jgi:hypothetical protein
VASKRRGDDKPDTKPVCQHGNRRQRANASAAILETGPSGPIEHERDTPWLAIECAVKRHRPLCECAKPRVDWSTAGADRLGCIDEVGVAVLVVRRELVGVRVGVRGRECGDRVDVRDSFGGVVGPWHVE